MLALRRTFLFLIFFSSFQLKAGNHFLDSLESLLKIAKEDTSKVILLNLISEKKEDPLERVNQAQQALDLAQKLNFTRGIALAYYNLAAGNNSLMKYDLTLSFSLKQLESETALEKQESVNTNDKTRKANATFLVAQEYLYHAGNYEKALDYYIRALHMREELKNRQHIAYSLNGLGNYYKYQGNNTKALEYYQQTLQLREKIVAEDGNPGLKNEMASTLINIGNIFLDAKKYDKALEYYEKTLKIKEELNDEGGAGMCFFNMARAFGGQGDYEKALEYNVKTLELETRLKSEQGVGMSLMAIGEVFLAKGEYRKAVINLEKSLPMIKKTGPKVWETGIYANLAEASALSGDFKMAYQYHKRFKEVQDSLLNEDNMKQMTEMSTKYDTEKKDKELLLKDTEIQKQQVDAKQRSLERNAFVIGFLLMILLAVFIFRSYRLKKKANEAISQQKEIIEEKNKEILDSIHYAKRIQKALFASEGLLKKNLSDYFVLHKPKDIVSGDFYWSYPLPVSSTAEQGLLLCAADCTGHGVPGAFMSLLSISFLNEAAIEKKISSPTKVLEHVREQIISALNPEGTDDAGKDGMDCVLCRVDTKAMQLDFACANNPLWLIRKGEILEYKPDKMPVGMQHGEKKPFTLHSLQLEKGDAIYMFTDGYADQFGGDKGKKFKYKQLEQSLLAIHRQPMEEQKKTLNDILEKWRGNLEQVDDILIIGIQV